MPDKGKTSVNADALKKIVGNINSAGGNSGKAAPKSFISSDGAGSRLGIGKDPNSVAHPKNKGFLHGDKNSIEHQNSLLRKEPTRVPDITINAGSVKINKYGPFTEEFIRIGQRLMSGQHDEMPSYPWHRFVQTPSCFTQKSTGTPQSLRNWNPGEGIFYNWGAEHSLMLIGVGLMADGAESGAKIFQLSNAEIRAAALRNGIPTARIDQIMCKTTTFSTVANTLGRGTVVLSALISIKQVIDAFGRDDMDGVIKAMFDLGVGAAAAAIGGIPGAVLYGIYLLITTSSPYRDSPLPYINPLFCVPDNTYVAPPVMPPYRFDE